MHCEYWYDYMKFKKVHTLKLALKLEDSQWSSNRLDVRGEGIFFNNIKL